MRGKYYKEKYRVIWQNRNVGWIYLREMKIYVHTNTCVQIFIAPLFVIAPNWEQPTCTLTEE